MSSTTHEDHQPWSDDAAQARAVAHRDGVLLVLGAPGTGRTDVVVHHVRGRILGGAAPDSCLVLAPSRAAAARLRSRIGAGLGRTHTEPLARTPASLAFSVLRLVASREGEPLPRLISGAEQDVVLRELLAGHREAGGGPAWPPHLAPALATAGFRAQLRDLLMRAVEHALSPDDLRALGEEHGRPEWACAADLLEEYDQVTALSDPGSYDPAWICTAAADALEDDELLREDVHSRIGLVAVDDAQELTASAARLLDAVRPRGCPALMVGDPDSAAQGFRGALPGLFVELARRWHEEDGSASRTDPGTGGAAEPWAPVVLAHRHGCSLAVAEVADRVAARIGVVGSAAHRKPRPGPAQGSAQVVLTASAAQESAHVARWLRHAHLVDGIPWSGLAVLARSGRQQETVRRALSSGGVPVHLDRSGLPLGQDPAVEPLLLAFDVVTREDDDHPWWRLTPEEAVALVTSPLGGLDPVGLRRVRRRLRVEEMAAGGSRAADELLAEALVDPGLRSGVPSDVHVDLHPLARVGSVLDAGWLARTEGGPGGTAGSAEDVLWALWDASGLAVSWAEQAWGGGPVGARADRDLDAVLVLFGAAEAYVERLPGSRPRSFLEHVRGAEVAADTLVVGARSPEVVEVLTPQAAAGRRWQRVAVVGVQDGVWPDLRLRDTLLGAQALVAAVGGRPVSGPEAWRAAQTQVRADEVRQFHVAVSRAADQLLVTAVSSTDEQPSALLDLVDPGFRDRPVADAQPPLTLRGLVGELRRAAVGAHRAGERQVRDRAVDLLVRLAAEEVPGADPATWWAAREVSSLAPLRTDRPVRVSPSRVQTFIDCPLRWFLTTRGADTGEAGAAELGTLVHDVVATRPDASREELVAELGLRWADLGLPDGWVSDRARARAEEMLTRYSTYVADARAQGRELVGTELDLAVTIRADQPDGQDVSLAGAVDRLERDRDGRLVVVDLKTGSHKPSQPEVDAHAQLAAYQVAVEEGAFAAHGSGSGGARLVQLGTSGPVAQTQGALEEQDDPGWARRLLLEAGAGMSAGSFAAQDMDRGCRTCPARFSCPIVPEGGQR